jgi:hypothetical protein
MPPKTLLQRMGERFQLLSSSGGRHTRQATLRATLDWSWELLSRDEQQALSQLSVFEGGFTLEAAEAVLSLEKAWPTDAVQALVDKSLVRQTHDDRFDLLLSVQEYAAEDKRAGIGALDEAGARHGAWFAPSAPEAVDSLVLRCRCGLALGLELDSLLAACRRAVTRRGSVAVELLSRRRGLCSRIVAGSGGFAFTARVAGLCPSPYKHTGIGRVRSGAALHQAGRGGGPGASRRRRLWRAKLGIASRASSSTAWASPWAGADRRSLRELRRRAGRRATSGTAAPDLPHGLAVIHGERGRMWTTLGRVRRGACGGPRVGDRAEGRVLANLGELSRGLGRMGEAAHHVATLATA